MDNFGKSMEMFCLEPKLEATKTKCFCLEATKKQRGWFANRVVVVYSMETQQQHYESGFGRSGTLRYRQQPGHLIHRISHANTRYVL